MTKPSAQNESSLPNEARLRLALESAQMGTWDWDLRTGQIVWSSKHEELFGFAPHQFQGSYAEFESRLHPEDRARILQTVHESLRDGTVYSCEFRVVWPDGSVHWLAGRGQALYDDAGQPLRMLGVIHEVTERKQAETELIESRDRLRTVIETEPACVKVVGRDGRLLEMNSAGLAMIEAKSTAEACQQPLVEYILPEFRNAFQQLHQSVMEGNSGLMEFEIIGLKGTRRWLETHAVPLRNAAGQIHALLGVTRDITDRKRSEALAAGQRQVLEKIADGASMSETLDQLLRLMEAQAPEMLTSILLVDEEGSRLRHGAAPSLPKEYVEAIDGAPIGPMVGSCGTAAYRNEAVFVEDIETDPLWAGYKQFALGHGLRACWSTPIPDANHRVLGTFAIYYREPGRPTPRHLQLIDVAIHLAAISITHDRSSRTVRESESSLALAQRVARMGSWEVDLTRKTLKWSDETFRIFGLEPRAFQPSSEDFFERVHPKDRDLVSAARRHALKTREPYQVQHRILWPDGAERVVHEHADIFSDAEGRPVRLVGVVHDITERIQAENRRRESEDRFRQVVETIREVFWMTDTEKNQMLYVSPSYEEVWGRPCRELYERPRAWIEAIHAEDRDRVLRAALEKQARGDYDEEYRIIRPDGSIRWIRDRAFPIKGEEGRVTRIVGVAEDISVLQQAREDLRRRERHFRSLIENAHDLITIVGRDGLIRFQSPSSRSVLGYEPESLMNSQVFDFIHEEDQTKVRAELESAFMDPERPDTVAFRFRHADGSWRYLESIGKRLTSEEEPLVVVNSRDITERRHLEEQYRQSQKMEAIGQLAGGVAHDFNNLLTVIQIHASLLLGEGVPSPKSAEHARHICQAAERAAALTRQLLLFGRKQVMQPVLLNLNEVVGNMTKMLQRILGEDVLLSSEFAPGLPLLYADAGMIEQILMNLSVNARDAMPQGGRLHIRTTRERPAEPILGREPGGSAGHYVCLTVEDTGCGMPPEIVSRIFEPFFTTKEIGKGTGLGLATVYGIVRQHQGWIDVASQVGIGTVFKVFLPATEEPAPPKDEPDGELALPGGHETILVVEDEEAVRWLVVELLQRWGYQVLEAVSGVAALSVWEESKDKIDLLLTDLVMPGGLTGRELAARLTRERPGLKVVFTSGYSEDVAGSESNLHEGLNYLQKPYHPLQLAQTIRNCLDANGA